MQPTIKKLGLRWSTLAILPLVLTGCLGGTVAQQLARSMLMQGADKVATAAIDAHDRNEKAITNKALLKDTVPDEYQTAFVHSGFEPVQIQIEPLPQIAEETETPIQFMQESKLVSVEVWNLLIGDEKQHLLEKARLQGSTIIPPKEDWNQWQIAVGAVESRLVNNKQQSIIFLIPPDIGKMRTGGKALVELSSAGELNIARYAIN